MIGSGIAGNAAAWALSKRYSVTLFEKEGRPGGHSATVDIAYGDREIAVDTGFIVYNDVNYPLLTRLFDHLGVKTARSNMSFGVSLDDGRFEWSGQGFRGIFAQRQNLFSPGFLFMLREIFKFNRLCKDDLKSGALCGNSFGEYLSRRKFSKRLKENYLVPMTAAIWSSPPKHMLEFPAESLVRFMDNHRLIHPKAERPKWRTVIGGSRQYVTKLLTDFEGELRLTASVIAVDPVGDGVTVRLADGQSESFDDVVIATHTDQALAMLSRPSAIERSVLGAVAYKPNTVYLHRDPMMMPRRRAAWSAWNYLGTREAGTARDISVTYWMNRLQNIDPRYPIFISLNPLKAPDAEKIFARYTYHHPMFDSKALAAQERLPQLQGARNIWYCGAWTRYGFHEDGLASGLHVAELLGAPSPLLANARRHPALQPARQLKPSLAGAFGTVRQ